MKQWLRYCHLYVDSSVLSSKDELRYLNNFVLLLTEITLLLLKNHSKLHRLYQFADPLKLRGVGDIKIFNQKMGVTL